jgi:hypothetical protein
MTPTRHDAAQRRPVLLPDGRVAALMFVARNGQTAKVALPGGVWLTTKRDALVLVPLS